MSRRRKNLKPPAPYATKWADVHDLLTRCRSILQEEVSGEPTGKTTEALKFAELALVKAGSWCHRADRARSMGLTVERSIRDNVVLPLMEGAPFEYCIGAISSVLEIIEREAGMAIYRAQQRRDVDLLVAGFVDEANRRIVEKFNSLVSEAIKSYPDPRKKKSRR